MAITWTDTTDKHGFFHSEGSFDDAGGRVFTIYFDFPHKTTYATPYAMDFDGEYVRDKDHDALEYTEEEAKDKAKKDAEDYLEYMAESQ